MAILYISPSGSGLKDGSSAANAGTLANLNSFIGAAGAGGEVRLLADQGAYQQNTYLGINRGGSDGAPVTIRGVDGAGNSMAAEITGTRAVDWAPGKSEGTELFRLLGGANNLSFQDLNISNVGNGAFRTGSDISNLSISNVNASNVTRFFEDNVSGAATSASVTGLTIKNLNIEGYSRAAIDLGYNSSNIRIENVVGDSKGQNGGLFVTGVQLSDTVHDVVLQSVTMKNNYGNGTESQYWNGDGFVTETGVYNVLFKDTVASGNTDAGYDLKSSSTVLINTTASGNNENYRLWSTSISIINGISSDPTHSGGFGGTAHLWMADGAIATVKNFSYFDSDTPQTLFCLTQSGATLYLSDTQVPPDYMSLIKLYDGSTVQVLVGGTYVPIGSIPLNQAPTDITLSDTNVQENALADTVVATLRTTDPDANDTHNYSLSGEGADKFEIVNDRIVVKAGTSLDFEATRSYALTVSTTDQDGLGFSKTFQINVTDVMETGTSKNDLMTGGAGADKLAGGAGNDIYIVNAAGDSVIELAYQGTDTVQTNLDAYTLGANVENLVYTGTGDFAGTGNELANDIRGGAGADTLRGNGGNDTIDGGDDSDTIFGDDRHDVLHGGNGDDVIFGGNDADSIWGDDGNDSLYGDLDVDTLYGGAGDDHIDGGRHGDVMYGGLGDDVYEVDSAQDAVVENAGEGVDMVRSTVTYTLTNNVEDLVLVGSAAINGTGNDLDNTLIGNDKANKLMGGAGNDTLDGGKGDDRLIGGAGDDTYLFGLGSGKDTIDNTHTDNGKDVLHFKDGIAALDLWFDRDGGDLVINVVGTGDSARLVGWYGNANHQISQFELADGQLLDAGSVGSLVDAMAHAAPTAPANLNNLSSEQHDAVVSVVAATWH